MTTYIPVDPTDVKDYYTVSSAILETKEDRLKIREQNKEFLDTLTLMSIHFKLIEHNHELCDPIRKGGLPELEEITPKLNDHLMLTYEIINTLRINLGIGTDYLAGNFDSIQDYQIKVLFNDMSIAGSREFLNLHFARTSHLHRFIEKYIPEQYHEVPIKDISDLPELRTVILKFLCEDYLNMYRTAMFVLIQLANKERKMFNGYYID